MCEVFYNSPGKGKLTFRKFFKFQVMKPLDVKTKFYNAEVDKIKMALKGRFLSSFLIQSEDVFLEAQVQNVTSGYLCLEKVALEPSPMFKVSALNTIKDKVLYFY